MAVATDAGLRAERATVLQSSNKVTLRLLPCDVVARVAPIAHQHGAVEVDLALRLAELGAPVAVLDPRVAPRPYGRDAFEITFWRFCEPVERGLDPTAYATGLAALHRGMRRLDAATPHVTHRVDEAERTVAAADLPPGMSEDDRALLLDVLRRHRATVSGAVEQVIHGEPHPGNVIATADGPRFIDLETVCRGPVAFDVAHVPEAVAAQYPDIDDGLLADCRELVLAMAAAWRWDPDDRLPDGRRFGAALVASLRAGPPWPTVGAVFERLDPPPT